MNIVRCVGSLLVCLAPVTVSAQSLKLNHGDRIALVGNTLAERMQHDGWLETLIHCRFPEHELVFRNLGFSGDELTLRLRSQDFGSPDDWLRKNETDVVFAFFGYNESFAGANALEKFRQELDAFAKHTLGQRYNGEGRPRLVLFSPIAHEDLGNRNLPDGGENNSRLGVYTQAMADVAAANGVPFVDLFAPTRDEAAQSEDALTINGIHLNERGNRFVAEVIDQTLFGPLKQPHPTVLLEAVRADVRDKDFHWFNRYRTTDGYSIYGGRADLKFVDGQSNRDVMQREMEVLDVLTANRDRRIWAVTRGLDLAVPDNNTPPFLPVQTNKPGAGPNGVHLFLGGDEAIKLMTVHAGMQVNLFASEERFPELASPVQMSFDNRGRLWVAAWPSYPHWKPKDEMNDKLLIFEDGDGRADRCRTFADKLHNPTGFEFWGGGVIVAMAPDLLFLKDTDGDDVADVREYILHGIDSADTHHTANSFTLDPGGALYFQEGTFHHTQVESPWGPPVRSANAAVFRFEPRTWKFDTYVAYSFANPHGHVFDRWGQDFVTDGTGNVNYYAAAFSGHVDFPDKHPGMEPFFKQRVRPCGGTEILSSRHFPDNLQGNYLNANVIGFQGILQYRFADEGSGFKGTEVEPIVFSSDPNFRPVDIEIGPDGAIYLVDWHNPVIGHMQHNLRDPSRDRVHGRVYRVSYPGRPLSQPPKIAGEPIARLLDVLKHPEDRVRYRARIELSSRGTDDVIAAAGQWLGALDRRDPEYEHHRLEGLWLHQAHNVVDEDLLRDVLRSPDYRARAAATRVLCYQRDGVADPLKLLAAQADDEHPRVRLEAVRACSFFRDVRAADVALAALRHPTDYYIDYTLRETMRQLEPYWKEAIRAGRPLAADNPAGVDYLLQSVSTAELVKLPRTQMVYLALLARDQIVHDYRHEALLGLAKLNRTDELTELMAAIERGDRNQGAGGDAVLSDLAHMLTGRPRAELQTVRERLAKLAAESRRPFTRQIAYVTLMTADAALDPTWSQAAGSVSTLRDLLDAVPLIPDPKLRAAAHARVVPLLTGLPAELPERVRADKGTAGRYVRIELPQRRGTLTLAEVQVFSDGANIAPQGTASQSSTAHGGPASRAIDGNTSGRYGDGGQTHTNENERRPWWELDLQGERSIDAIVVWNRREGQLGERLNGFTLSILDGAREVVWQKTDNPAPAENVRFDLEGDPAGSIRRSAINAVVTTGTDGGATFKTLAAFIRAGTERPTAVRAITRIPRQQWPQAELKPLIDSIVESVGKLPADERTAPAVRDTLQLGDDLAALLPSKQGQAVRKQLRELGVPVIVVRPVPHQMVYDRTELYVEAGRPLEIVFDNVDIMPHNLIVTRPGALEKVGIEAEKMAASPDAFARQFVPSLPEVLHATPLLQPRQTARINFEAPAEPGDYPYVCTFPGHWRRMYGTMHVVRSLDDVPPEKLLASSAPTQVEARAFVRAWTVADLTSDLAHLHHGTNRARGKELFTAVACVQCHRMNGAGGQVGPDLIGVKEKLATGKVKPLEVLTEMIEPSKVIEEKFRTQVFELTSGKVVSGLIVEEKDGAFHVRSNPLEQKQEEPVVVRADEIEERVTSQVSIMPLGLLNTLTREEVLDLLAYVIAGGE
jgi:putative heme-binding domain-containing protein